ncbi:hypothetical protein B0H13DRAFT_2412643 [Mycena leptocephala]|nr:hypothetical protein B0H13DRAFT_2412643 [Mycena leptocephala]
MFTYRDNKQHPSARGLKEMWERGWPGPFLWRMTLDIFPLNLLHGIMLDPALWGCWERTEWGCGACICAALPVNAACLGWVECPRLERERTSDADSLRNGMARLDGMRADVESLLTLPNKGVRAAFAFQSADQVSWDPDPSAARETGPNLYVEIDQGGGRVVKTPTVKEDFTPKWDFVAILTPDSISADITLGLYHDTQSPGRGPTCLGQGHINIGEFLELCEPDEIGVEFEITLRVQENILARLSVQLSSITDAKQEGDTEDTAEALWHHREEQDTDGVTPPKQGSSSQNLANAIQTGVESQGDPEDINEGCSIPNPDDIGFNNRTIALEKWLEEGGELEDVGKAVELARHAVDMFIAPHPGYGIALKLLVDAVKKRFEKHGDLQDINEVIELYREDLEMHPAPHPNRSTSLYNLANNLQTRFEKQGDLKDINESIGLYREALQAPHPGQLSTLNNLANAIQARFEQQGDAKDLDEAIELHIEALQSLKTAQRGDPKDLDEAIKLHRDAVQLGGFPHPNRSMFLNNLAITVNTRFDHGGDLRDLDEAIELQREVLEINAALSPTHSEFLHNLATSVQRRFMQQGDLKDLDEAIKLHQEALKIDATPHTKRSMFLCNLATAFQTRFEQQGDSKDLAEAIKLHREALNLASAVKKRFKEQGDPNDLDEAIALHRRALQMAAAHQPDFTAYLTNLTTALHTRFEERGDRKDLDEAISLCKEALKIDVNPHPQSYIALNNLAMGLLTRFEQWGDQKDLEETILFSRKALKVLVDPHVDRYSTLNNLANGVRRRFVQQEDPKDIDEAVDLYRQALKISSPTHKERSSCLTNIATALQARFELLGNRTDLDEAIQHSQEALGICASPHPRRAKFLINHGACILHSAYLCDRNKKTLDDAISAIQEASMDMYSSPLSRLSACHKWAVVANMNSHSSCLDAYRRCINHLPQLAACSLSLQSRHQILTRADITSLASASATCAIGLNKNNVAVELLEASRSIFWSQALNLRSPLDKLANVRSNLAVELRELSRQLEQASFRDTSRSFLTATQEQLISIETEAIRCRKLNEKWEDTIKIVQQLPGFEDFLQPKSIASLRQATVSGPVIILLAGSSTSCTTTWVGSSEIGTLCTASS